MPNTVRLHRVLATTPEKLYRSFLELVPNERLRYTDKFDDPNMPGEMTVTVSLRKVAVGTELTIVQEGVPDVIPVEACYLGWQESLENLKRLVEPNIDQ